MHTYIIIHCLVHPPFFMCSKYVLFSTSLNLSTLCLHDIDNYKGCGMCIPVAHTSGPQLNMNFLGHVHTGRLELASFEWCAYLVTGGMSCGMWTCPGSDWLSGWSSVVDCLGSVSQPSYQLETKNIHSLSTVLLILISAYPAGLASYQNQLQWMPSIPVCRVAIWATI